MSGQGGITVSCCNHNWSWYNRSEQPAHWILILCPSTASVTWSCKLSRLRTGMDGSADSFSQRRIASLNNAGSSSSSAANCSTKGCRRANFRQPWCRLDSNHATAPGRSCCPIYQSEHLIESAVLNVLSLRSRLQYKLIGRRRPHLIPELPVCARPVLAHPALFVLVPA